jgi:hypothetical protein
VYDSFLRVSSSAGCQKYSVRREKFWIRKMVSFLPELLSPVCCAEENDAKDKVLASL